MPLEPSLPAIGGLVLAVLVAALVGGRIGRLLRERLARRASAASVARLGNPLRGPDGHVPRRDPGRAVDPRDAHHPGPPDGRAGPGRGEPVPGRRGQCRVRPHAAAGHLDPEELAVAGDARPRRRGPDADPRARGRDTAPPDPAARPPPGDGRLGVRARPPWWRRSPSRACRGPGTRAPPRRARPIAPATRLRARRAGSPSSRAPGRVRIPPAGRRRRDGTRCERDTWRRTGGQPLGEPDTRRPRGRRPGSRARRERDAAPGRRSDGGAPPTRPRARRRRRGPPRRHPRPNPRRRQRPRPPTPAHADAPHRRRRPRRPPWTSRSRSAGSSSA